MVRSALGVGPGVLFRMGLLPASISTVRWYEDGAAYQKWLHQDIRIKRAIKQIVPADKLAKGPSGGAVLPPPPGAPAPAAGAPPPAAAPAGTAGTVQCPQCNHTNVPSNKFCASCGYNMTAVLAAAAPAPAPVAAPAAAGPAIDPPTPQP